jgi:hypothetical protein
MPASERGLYKEGFRPRHFGRLLALLALALQLFAPAIDVRSSLSSAETALSDGRFGPDIICHGGAADWQPIPASPGTPAPHHEHAGCCLGHGNANPFLPKPIDSDRAAADFERISYPAPTVRVVAARFDGDARARAPPRSA